MSCGDAVFIEQVKPGSPAATAGLEGGQFEVEAGDTKVVLGGDVVLTVNGVASSGPKAVGAVLARLKPGESIRYEVVRQGASRFIDVPLPDLPAVPKLPTRK
jgi:S1-C subfamily serine protease